MYVITMTVTKEESAALAKAHFEKHQAWFNQHIADGHFLLVGPSKTHAMSGVIIAQAESRTALDQLISQDAYYPDIAHYDVNEFSADEVSPALSQFQGK